MHSSAEPSLPPRGQVGKPVTYCKLDIDIHNNRPNVLEHTKSPNTDGWHGATTASSHRILPGPSGFPPTAGCDLPCTIQDAKSVCTLALVESAVWCAGSEVSVTIEGNWTSYKNKIVTYLRHMAVITPYAQVRRRFCCG